MALDVSDIVGGCSLLSQLPAASMDRLVGMGRLIDFARGKLVVRQDDPCPGMYIVGSGMLRVYNLAASGKEHVLQMTSPSQTVLEVAAILGIRCPAFVQATEDTRAVLLPAALFSKALDEDHILCRQLLNKMCHRVRHFVTLLEDIVLRDATARVARHLLAAADGTTGIVQLPALKKHLASHLNLTSETLSRCLKQLNDEGMIKTNEEQELKVIQRDRLRSIAEGFPE